MEDIMINEEFNEMEVKPGLNPLQGALIGSAVTLAVIAVVKVGMNLFAKHKAQKEQAADEHDFVDGV